MGIKHIHKTFPTGGQKKLSYYLSSSSITISVLQLMWKDMLAAQILFVFKIFAQTNSVGCLDYLFVRLNDYRGKFLTAWICPFFVMSKVKHGNKKHGYENALLSSFPGKIEFSMFEADNKQIRGC